MSDKRSVSTDALETLGTIIGEGAGRDAIHLAVEPVIAKEYLEPGTDVGIASDGKASAHVKKVGIVDPFLTQTVKPGEKFWLVVYPRQITSLRHVWSHPDFPEESIHVEPTYSSESEKWIRNYASGIHLDYYTLMEGAKDYVDSQKRGGWGNYLNYGSLLEGEYVPDEFWDHYVNVTGEEVEDKHRGSFFSCSC